MKNSKIGILTIGQSPRTDMTPEMEKIFGSGVTILEKGALDDLSPNEIADLAPDCKGEPTYVSRLRDASSAKLSKKKLMPLVQAKLSYLEKEVNNIILACTGDFPDIVTTIPVLMPDKLLRATVSAVLDGKRLGIILPLDEQKESLAHKWADINVIYEAASPYQEDDFIEPAKKLAARGASLIVMDCMGYTEQHKKIVNEVSGLPVILSRTLTARIATELL